MEILTSVRRLYISFKSLVNDFVYSFGRAAILLLVEVQNHTVPVRERRRIRVNRSLFQNPLPTHESTHALCGERSWKGIIWKTVKKNNTKLDSSETQFAKKIKSGQTSLKMISDRRTGCQTYTIIGVLVVDINACY